MKPVALVIAATLALAISAPAMAQQPFELDDLDADRTSGGIEIEFEYDGSACEEVGPAEVGAQVGGTLSVNFPIKATAEVCTRQIVEIEVEQTVAADAGVTRVDVTLTSPDGIVIGAGSTDVDND